MQFRLRLGLALCCAFLLSLATPVVAQSPPPSGAVANGRSPHQQEVHEAAFAAVRVATRGPADIALLDQARLALPAGMVFIPATEAGRYLHALGNQVPTGLVGMVAGTGKADWGVVIRHVAEGLVKDDAARDWKPDDLLSAIRSSTEEDNKERAERGLPALEIVGWLEPPAYQFDTHRMVWALQTQQSGAADTGVNYNTIALGRDGFISLNMITRADSFQADKPVVATLLGNLQFVSGKRYEDFVASTDRVAAYGLAALLGAVVAKKLGLLAIAGLFVAKFAKVGLIAVAALGAGAARFFRRKPKHPTGGEAG